jgi:DNA (cytosine-5)-methyltransferase 1
MNVIDLYSGAGGLSLGFLEEGFNIIAGIDKWDEAIDTYRYNHSSVGLSKDIKEISTDDLPLSSNQVDVVIGGPPCKGFSIAGKRDPDDDRNKNIPRFIEYVDELNPDIAVMENVVGILSMEDGGVVDYIVDKYENIGYNIDYKVLKSENYGIPQTRHRVFFIALRENLDTDPVFPEETTPNKNVPVKDVLDQNFESYPDHSYTNHSDDMVEKISKVDYDESLYDSYSEAWKRLNPNKPAHTIKENHGAPFIHPYEDRVGTPRECATIQTFPKDFKFKGSKSSKLKQIGNAVPPKLARQVASSIRSHIN